MHCNVLTEVTKLWHDYAQTYTVHCELISLYVTSSGKTLHVRVFYTSSQKQLSSPDSTTDF